MKTQYIYLVRHGETNANKEGRYQGIHVNQKLDNTGRKQIELLAKFMKEFCQPPKIIYCSALLRTIESACIIKNELFGRKKYPEIISIPELNEINQGNWDGKTWKEVEEKYPDLYKLWQKDPMQVEFPDGDKMKEARKKIWEAWDNIILKRSQRKDIVFIGHGAVNVQILSKIPGATSIRSLYQANSCINIIERKGDKFIVKLLNSTTHLL